MTASKIVRALSPKVGYRASRYIWYELKSNRKPIIQGSSNW